MNTGTSVRGSHELGSFTALSPFLAPLYGQTLAEPISWVYPEVYLYLWPLCCLT